MLNDRWKFMRREQTENDLILAWNIANFSRVKRLPDLGALLRKLRTGTAAPPTQEQVDETKRIAEEGDALLQRRLAAAGKNKTPKELKNRRRRR